jgi:hypothetical protein
VIVAFAIAMAAAFGAGDQYLGSLSAHPWATDISLLSAPWLLIAFFAGWTQREPKKAAILGLACTGAALVGYGVMTLSPVEHAHLTAQTLRGFFVSESGVILGGVVTGPLFGWFGNRWRAQRAWAGALVLAACVCLEPFAHSVAGDAIRFPAVSHAEIAAGLAMIVYVAWTSVGARTRTATTDTRRDC